MLEFKEEFFKEETRCDFVICEKMKRAWAAEMEVLSEVIRVCKKYKIPYFADWGTLLGAVRHKGYVPWDDDLDIALRRKDFFKLMEMLPGELPESYHISSFFMPGEHNQPLSCVMNSREINTQPEFLEKFHGCPYIVGVDIAVLDYIPRDEELVTAQRTLYSAVYDAAKRFPVLEKSGELDIYLPQIEELCGVTFDRNKPLRRQLWMLGEQICGMYNEQESDYLTWFPRTVCHDKKFRLKKEWYSSSIEMPFENITVSVPQNYHDVLTMMYGNYEVYQKGWRAHGYPFYAAQDKLLNEIL